MGKKPEEKAMNALLFVIYGVLLWIVSLILQALTVTK